MSLRALRAARAGRAALLAMLLGALASSCASWRPAGRHEGFELYVRDGSSIDLAPFERAMVPALAFVEERLGDFQDDVRVHAWEGGVELSSGKNGRIREGDVPVAEVPGIGPARVFAFHSRGGSGPLEGSHGIFLGEADAGAAIHELVHARLAEQGARAPLWYEEGLAGLLADGALRDGRWVHDGLALWPWSELREQTLDDAELGRLLGLRAGDEHSVRDNLLVHFLGWALVFDLASSDPAWGEPSWDWRPSLAAARGLPLADARAALGRTLDPELPARWLEQGLADPEPGARLAVARGTWKVATAGTRSILRRALVRETDPEVKASLAVNLIAGAGEDPRGWWRTRRTVLEALRDLHLPDPAEDTAIRRLYLVHRGRLSPEEGTASLQALRRFWEE